VVRVVLERGALEKASSERGRGLTLGCGPGSYAGRVPLEERTPAGGHGSTGESDKVARKCVCTGGRLGGRN